MLRAKTDFGQTFNRGQSDKNRWWKIVDLRSQKNYAERHMLKESERYQGTRYEQILYDEQQKELIIAFFGLYFETVRKLISFYSKETKKIKYSVIVTVE